MNAVPEEEESPAIAAIMKSMEAMQVTQDDRKPDSKLPLQISTRKR